MVPSQQGYDPTVHLSLADVAFNHTMITPRPYHDRTGRVPVVRFVDFSMSDTVLHSTPAEVQVSMGIVATV